MSSRSDPPQAGVLDEDVSIVSYDPAWPARFATESARIRDALELPPCERYAAARRAAVQASGGRLLACSEAKAAVIGALLDQFRAPVKQA